MFYFASALDSVNQRKINLEICGELETILNQKAFLPQRDVGVLGQLKDTGQFDYGVFIADLDAIKESGLVLVNLDATDTGVFIEIGYACAKGIPCFGVTQFRHNKELKMWNNMLFAITGVLHLHDSKIVYFSSREFETGFKARV